MDSLSAGPESPLGGIRAVLYLEERENSWAMMWFIHLYLTLQTAPDSCHNSYIYIVKEVSSTLLGSVTGGPANLTDNRQINKKKV